MSEREVEVHGSVEFRDAVMIFKREGRQPYARLVDGRSTEYRIIGGDPHDLARKINLGDLFGYPEPPVQMEDFAQALVMADRAGTGVPKVIVFAVP